MKNKLQPTRTSFSRNFQCKKAPRWLIKFFSFGYWKSGGPVKKTTLYVNSMLNLKIFNLWNFVKILICANALKKPLICSKRFLAVCAIKLFCSTFTSELNIFQVWIQKGFERSVGWELGCCGRCQVGFIIRMPKTIFEIFVFFVNLKFRDHLQCYIWVGLDGMGWLS